MYRALRVASRKGKSLSLEQYVAMQAARVCAHVHYMHMYALHDIFCSVHIALHSPDHIETLAYCIIN